MVKVDVWVTYHYGAQNLSFRKRFNMPFAPFFGMEIFEQINGSDNTVRLEEYEMPYYGCRTVIQFRPKSGTYYVEVRNVWKKAPPLGRIDEILEIFEDTYWERKDDVDIDQLKSLMERLG